MNEKIEINMRERIESIGQLPTFPETATEVVKLVNNTSVSMREVSNVIGQDPSLAAKVLKFVNSAFYGLHQSIASLQLALVMLGMKEIRNIVIGLSVFKTFDNLTHSKIFDKKQFWQHSVSVAQIARAIAQKLSLPMEGEEFTAGLLHDIGKIAFDQYFSEEFEAAWKKSFKQNVPLYQAEKLEIGVTHAEVGAWMASKWNLPIKLVEAIEHHHEPAKAEHGKILVAVVSLADILSRIEGVKFGGYFAETSLENSEPWQILLKERPQLNDLDVERFTFELETEVIKSLEFLSMVGSLGNRAEV
ncbi:MAG: HDOD domain-containing protein [Candidatus Marinimicrobia bacterium]|nr:HDOD domain-containing protein [Candidatus Neomarinimicrobiota bacterium]